MLQNEIDSTINVYYKKISSDWEDILKYLQLQFPNMSELTFRADSKLIGNELKIDSYQIYFKVEKNDIYRQCISCSIDDRYLIISQENDNIKVFSLSKKEFVKKYNQLPKPVGSIVIPKKTLSVAILYNSEDYDKILNTISAWFKKYHEDTISSYSTKIVKQNNNNYPEDTIKIKIYTEGGYNKTKIVLKPKQYLILSTDPKKFIDTASTHSLACALIGLDDGKDEINIE